jgi:hypothetical protein
MQTLAFDYSSSHSITDNLFDGDSDGQNINVCLPVV